MSSTKTSRRRFLSSVALAPAALAVPRPISAAEPRLEFPVRPRERLSVTSYPFRAFIDAPGNHPRDPQSAMDLKDFAGMVATRFDVHNINPLASHFRSTEAPYIDQLQNAVQKAGSHIVDLGLGGRSFYHPDRTIRAEAVAYGRQWIDIAVALGSPSVRQHLSGASGVPADIGLTAETLGEMAAYGEKRNIVVNLENDTPISEDPFFLVAVIEKVRSPYLRALPDFANSMAPDNDIERNKQGVAAMFRHVFNICHVKDAYRGRDQQIHPVELPALFAIAKRSGFRGYYTMEADTPGDPYEITQRLVRETLEFL